MFVCAFEARPVEDTPGMALNNVPSERIPPFRRIHNFLNISFFIIFAMNKKNLQVGTVCQGMEGGIVQWGIVSLMNKKNVVQ